MGSYSELLVGGYPAFTWKNAYHTEIVNRIFQPEDYLSEKRKYTTKNRIVWGDTYDGKKGYFTFKGFKQTVGVCKKRLEIFGLNIKAVRKDFIAAKKIASEHHYYNLEYHFPISKISFKTYINEIKSIVTSKDVDYSGNRSSLRSCLTTDGLYISGQSFSAALYAILNCVDDSDIVEYDLTDVIDGGWVKTNVHRQIAFEKIIILTEGKSDPIFIGKALQVLYPYLSPYYHFMDFEGYKVEGSASALVRTLKAFAASSVKHPIIALFDNDAAGIKEMSHLPKVLPPNIKAMRLPDTRLAKKYPTIGPDGVKKRNVNGIACGIELYFGKAILAPKGIFSQVRLVGTNEPGQQCHGRLENKGEIQKLFLKKIKEGEHWEMPEMKLLLEKIFNAFHI